MHSVRCLMQGTVWVYSGSVFNPGICMGIQPRGVGSREQYAFTMVRCLIQGIVCVYNGSMFDSGNNMRMQRISSGVYDGSRFNPGSNRHV